MVIGELLANFCRELTVAAQNSSQKFRQVCLHSSYVNSTTIKSDPSQVRSNGPRSEISQHSQPTPLHLFIKAPIEQTIKQMVYKYASKKEAKIPLALKLLVSSLRSFYTSEFVPSLQNFLYCLIYALRTYQKFLKTKMNPKLHKHLFLLYFCF